MNCETDDNPPAKKGGMRVEVGVKESLMKLVGS